MTGLLPSEADAARDAENHLTSTAGVTYTYDGDGRRAMKSSGKLYWYGAGSDPLDETDSAGNSNNASFKEYAFFGGKRIARRDSANSVNYYFADHLGSARVVTNSSGTLLDDSDFYPFGGERPSIPPTPSSGNNYKFTGKERDTESGLDNFGARYDSSALGRFMSPDPVGGHRGVPQSLNKYAYAINNPLVLIDPTGLEVQWHDTKCKKGETSCPSRAQQAYEAGLTQLRESKDPKERARGEKLTSDYQRLQESKAIFEVVNQGGNETSHGDITYQGNDHFTVDLAGNTAYALSNNQKLAREFEHGRQVLDGELSFHHYSPKKGWLPFAYDRTDEAKAFKAGFDMEPASPGQGTIVNGIASSLNQGGTSSAVEYLRAHTTYSTLPAGPINVETRSPSIYAPPN